MPSWIISIETELFVFSCTTGANPFVKLVQTTASQVENPIQMPPTLSYVKCLQQQLAFVLTPCLVSHGLWGRFHSFSGLHGIIPAQWLLHNILENKRQKIKKDPLTWTDSICSLLYLAFVWFDKTKLTLTWWATVFQSCLRAICSSRNSALSFKEPIKSQPIWFYEAWLEQTLRIHRHTGLWNAFMKCDAVHTETAAVHLL